LGVQLRLDGSERLGKKRRIRVAQSRLEAVRQPFGHHAEQVARALIPN
jgi:hypothetical protein